jgi:hypothetical protein
MALPASAGSIARVIGEFPQGNSTFEQANPSSVGLLGSYHNLGFGPYRTVVYQGANCDGVRLSSAPFHAATVQQGLGAFDLTTAHSVGLLHLGRLVSCDTHPVVVKGGPF